MEPRTDSPLVTGCGAEVCEDPAVMREIERVAAANQAELDRRRARLSAGEPS